ncbi:MAG TPA: DUF3455 domain-containing protein, partial [Myxococcales bacterium]|nr:DUF3455 domain-containing protein [Myxococcales bacterium]
MKPIRFALPAFVSLAGLLLLLAACASAPAPKPAAVPENLKVPGGQPFLLRAAARGAQIYLCKPKANDPAAFEWSLKAPDADLFDQAGAKIGRHYAGPTWENADGSRVVGEAVERSPAEGAIPWLLLRARSNEGAGAFSGVKYVQRLDTKGGL